MDARLHASPPLADAFHQRRHRGLEVNEQIRRRQVFDDHIVKLTVGPVVSQAEHLHIVQSEDTRTGAGNVDRGVDLSYNGTGPWQRVEPVKLPARRRVFVTVLESPFINAPETALLSEPALAEDWNRPEEDEAWSHLQHVLSP